MRLERSGEGTILIDNTSKRKSDLDEIVSSVIAKGTLDMAEGLTLRGKLSFANAQVTGRSGSFALKMLSEHLHAVPYRRAVSADLSCALKFLRERVRGGLPRFIPRPLDRCFVVFTDASFHDDRSGGLGGVLISPQGSVVAWFDHPVSADDTAPFLGQRGQTCIGDLEAIAVPIAYDVWSAHLCKTESVSYIDNVGAQFALIKGYATSHSLTLVCHHAARLFEVSSMLVWRARVPSASNIADAPSRCVASPLLPRALRCRPAIISAAWARVTLAVGLGGVLVPGAV